MLVAKVTTLLESTVANTDTVYIITLYTVLFLQYSKHVTLTKIDCCNVH